VARDLSAGGVSEIASLVDEVHERFLSGSSHRPQDVASAVAAYAPRVTEATREMVVDRVLARLSGLGQLRDMFADERITDIMVNGPGPITVERDGELQVVGVIGEVELDRLVEFLLGPTGRRVDRRTPVVDVRLDERTRCHVAVPPVAVGGTCLSLRRFPPRVPPLEAFGSEPVVAELRELVDRRANIVVFGPTGSGKTSLLASMLGEVVDRERVVVVEEAAELVLSGDHVVRLEAQPPNLDGLGGVSLADLVASSLRMRPDRLVIGEVRGGEAAHLLHAFSTGHRGSMGTVHAGTVEGALWRLEQLALAGGAAGDVRGQFVAHVDALIGMCRGPAGGREVEVIHRLRDDR
jgi:pilus assembly protein CpaF